MAPYTEDDMVNALFDITDNKISLRKASQRWNIPIATLSSRLSGKHGSRTEGQKESQRLPPSDERRIVEWILRQESLGYAPGHGVVRAIVRDLLRERGDTEPLGKNWMDGFKKRNPSIRTKVGRRTEAARYDGFTPKAVN